MSARLVVSVLTALTIAGCAASGPPVAAPSDPAPTVATDLGNASAMAALDGVLARCRAAGCGLAVGRTVEVDTVDVVGGVAVARFSRDLGDAPARPATVAAFERAVTEAVQSVYPGAPVRVETRGGTLSDLVPNAERSVSDRDADRLFAPPAPGPALVRPADASRQPTAGMAGRHVALWPSHGWYHNANGGPGAPGDGLWGWQRARLFTTVEDLLTVGFVTRELAPMLERAGAVTMLARERDVRAREVIVDNSGAGYSESGRWADGPVGFGLRPSYGDGENPFRLGTSRQTDGEGHVATWRPTIPEAGAYAVHVSYAPGPDRSDAVRYRVVHAGGETEVVVNQTMGAGTWVALGTFEFEAGTDGAVTLLGSRGGSVSADAVRFGGGRGVIRRGGATSDKPRWTEAARYYEQFAGAPPSVYNVTGEPGEDYVDDYRSRGEWVNWLRGAPFGPTDDRDNPGLGIPIDASVAWHTDAGQTRDGLIGTLMIYDAPGMDSTRAFPNGVSRLANRDLADGVQSQIVGDLRQLYTPDWPRRPLWDRNYSEAARPTVPAILLELLSHHNYRDMRHALDPRVRFDAARAVYKGLGRFLAEQRGQPFVPQPLRPTHLAALLDGDRVALSWRPQTDPVEPDALPTAYVIYSRDGRIGWDNGTRVEGTSVRLPAPAPGVVRSYRVAGVNAGGEGRPSEALAVGRAAGRGGDVLVVDGFDRVAPPDAVDRPDYAGFVDPVGVPDGLGVVTVGAQRLFDPDVAFVSDSEPGWGASGRELEATPVMGNDRDHTAAHARALVDAGFSVSSATDEAVWDGATDLARFDAVDLALGLERRTPWPDPDDARPPAFEALPGALRDRLSATLDGGGALVISGAHWASDAATDPASAAWVRATLGVEPAGVVEPTEAPATRALAGEGPLVPFTVDYGPERAAVRRPDVLRATPGAQVVRFYGDGERGAIVQRGRAVSVGIPLESITDERQRAAVIADAVRRALDG